MHKDITEHYSTIWESSPIDPPVFSKLYSNSDKLQKEQILDQFLKSMKSFRKGRRSRKSFSADEERQFFTNTRDFLKEGLDFTESQLGTMFSDELIGVTKAFVRQALAFDPQLKFSDVFQACRNAWIMHGLQLIMGIEIQLTPSIFAYSMLYPYTDNLIDDPQISALDKVAFSDRFRDRLSGQLPEPITKTENAVFRLVSMIENQYSRTDFPEVFESLLAIHDAQTNSMKLIQQNDALSESNILKIVLAKGGTSVLADGFLVAGRLTGPQKHFLFGYGAYLQLLDDLQDVEDDYAAGLMTVFSSSAFQAPLDWKLNKTYWFGEEVMKTLDHFEGKELDLFKSLMRTSMDLFIIEAIAQCPEAFSPDYVADLENHSPFHFSYIRKRKEKFTPNEGLLQLAIEEYLPAEKREQRLEWSGIL